MARAFVGFPIDLPREANLGEQFAHAIGADRVAHVRKRRRQLVEALRHPQQRMHRITQCGWFDETLEIVEQRRVTFILSSSAAAFSANTTPRKWRRMKVFR
jgi:hypothetical protein